MSSGIDWPTIGRETFERIVDRILSHIYGERGRPVEGRGGEGEIPGDYSVDGGKIIFEYKYFPDGFPSSSSRRRQIKRSFLAQTTKNNPDEWILIFPSKLTDYEQRFLQGLPGENGPVVGWRDRVWLDGELEARPSLSNYFRHYSDNDYLMEKAELLKDNPLIKNPQVLANRVRLLMDTVADADPDWTFDIAVENETIIQTLRPKHHNASLLSPVKVTFNALIPEGSDHARELQQADAFGYVEPITIPGDLIRDFRVDGPTLVSWEGDVGELQLGPDEPGPWIDADLMIFGASDEVLGTYLARLHGVGRGAEGHTFEVALGSLLSMTFRNPYRGGGTGSMGFKFAGATGATVPDVLETTDFICQLASASRLQIKINDVQIALIDISRQRDQPWVEDFRRVRDTAEDLARIETETRTKFRYPAQIDAEERVMIRAIRLMLDGYCVAHPTWNSFTAELTGHRDAGLDRLLTEDSKWVMRSKEITTVPLLGRDIELAHFCVGGYVSLDHDQIDAIQAAIASGDAEGHPIRMSGRPGDRVRMFLGDRFDLNTPMEITPWDIEGIIQKGLNSNGEPLAG